MKKNFAIFASILIVSVMAQAHVPALLLPLKGTPISSYFVGKSQVSRAVYSELTESDDYFVVQFYVSPGNEKTRVQLLTPDCTALPQYEAFQPSAVIWKGDLTWKKQGETNAQYLHRLGSRATARLSSNFAPGQRPTFYEDASKQNFWVGADWRGRLKPGLYSIVVFNTSSAKGNFVLGLNEKEAWTPDLFRYAGEVMPLIAAGICSPSGFTGHLTW